MNQSSFIRARQFKSPLSVIAGFLLRSRETQAQRAKDRTQEIQQLNKLLEQQRQAIRELEEQLARKNATIDRLEAEKQQLRNQPPTLPDDPNLTHHKFGPKMISLCVNLARRIGLRAIPDILKMVFEWLGTKAKLPDWTTVRTWMLRAGSRGHQATSRKGGRLDLFGGSLEPDRSGKGVVDPWAASFELASAWPTAAA